jgi:serine/threonine protein kinase
MLQKSGGVVDESTCWEYMQDVASAVEYMHNRHVMHRDIKPENLLVDHNGSLHLADFGWCVHSPPPHIYRFTICGTPEYVAPEVIIDDGKRGYSKHADLWALGILMFELIFGR